MERVIFFLENQLLNYDFRTDKSEIDLLLHDEFIEINTSGEYVERNRYFEGDGAGSKNLTMLDFKMMTINNKTILVTYLVINNVSKEEVLRSSLWVYNKGRWKLFFHQGTKVDK